MTDNPILQAGREQYQLEETEVQIISALQSGVETLKKKVEEIDEVKQIRLSLQELRQTKDMLDNERQSITLLQEHTAEELFDELTRVIEERESKRSSAKDPEGEG